MGVHKLLRKHVDNGVGAPIFYNVTVRWSATNNTEVV